MSIAKIHSALKKPFIDANLFAAAKIQLENIPFTKPTTGPWAAIFFLPNQPDVASTGASGFDVVDGILQIDLNYPLQSGTKTAEAMGESVRNLFTAGARLPYDGETAVIRSCGRSPGRVVTDCYRISITVYFYAHLTR